MRVFIRLKGAVSFVRNLNIMPGFRCKQTAVKKYCQEKTVHRNKTLQSALNITPSWHKVWYKIRCLLGPKKAPYVAKMKEWFETSMPHPTPLQHYCIIGWRSCSLQRLCHCDEWVMVFLSQPL